MSGFQFHMKKIVVFLFFLFFLSTLIIPATIVNKIVFLILIGIQVFYRRTISQDIRLSTVSPIVILMIFLFGFVISFFNLSDRSLSIQFLFSVVVLLLIYLITRFDIDLDNIVKKSGLILSLFTGFSFIILVLMAGSSMSSSYIYFFNKFTLGSLGTRQFSDETTFSFHLGTVPFLFLPFSLYIKSFCERRTASGLLAILILFTAIVSSASRGLVFMSLISLTLIIFLNMKVVSRALLIAASIPVVILILHYLITRTLIFSGGEESNTVKIGHFESFLDNLNVKNVIIGDGLGSYYYSKGVERLTPHTEITPLDMLRYFGFILAPVLFLAMAFPSPSLRSYLGTNKIYTTIFLLYLIFSFTNPILINSFGLLIVLWYWSKILRYKV